MTFEELMKRLSSSSEPQVIRGPSVSDYVKSQIDEDALRRKKPSESPMSQIFKLVGSLAPVAAGALMGGGEGAAIGAGVASQTLSADAERRRKEEDETDKYLRDRSQGFENMYLKSAMDAENMSAQNEQKNKALLTQVMRDYATSNAADEREKMRIAGAKDVARIRASSQSEAKKEAPTKGQESVDKKFGERYDDWVAGGGYTAVQSDIDKLEKEVLSKLDPKSTSRNPISGSITKSGMGAVFTPERRDLLDNLESVVQKTLKATLGAQFAQKEGERLIERAFNPQLSDAENYKRVKSLIEYLRQKASETDRAARYFEESGSLTGFKGGGVGIAPEQSEEIRVIKGVKYKKVDGGWEEVD